MKILLTGATGLMGREILQGENGEHEFFCVSRSKIFDSPQKDIEWIFDDFSSEPNQALYPPSIDAVIHLAQSEHFREFPEYANQVFNVNSLSTLRLLEYARISKAKTFIYASSGGVYGYSDSPFREDQPVAFEKDLGFYISTKLCSEILIRHFLPFMTCISLRFFFVYGPNQKSNMLIPRLVQSVQEEKPITLQGADGISINPTYVSDAASAIMNALTLADSQMINVGGPEILTLRQIGGIIGEEVGKEPVFDIQENVKPRNIMGDIDKMSRLLWKPRIRFREGIRKYIDFIEAYK